MSERSAICDLDVSTEVATEVWYRYAALVVGKALVRFALGEERVPIPSPRKIAVAMALLDRHHVLPARMEVGPWVPRDQDIIAVLTGMGLEMPPLPPDDGTDPQS